METSFLFCLSARPPLASLHHEKEPHCHCPSVTLN